MSGLSGGGAGVSVGAVEAFAKNIPAGWLECNGAAISRTLYAALFNEIGTDYGAGDGSTTFNLPDLRGEFVRGLDNGRGVDAGRVVGSAQADDIGSHSHSYGIPRSSWSGRDGYNNKYVSDSGGSGSQTLTSGAAGGAETRPRNVAMIYCIKY